MKNIFIILLFLTTISYSQVKNDKPPKFPPLSKGKITKLKKIVYYLNFSDLKQNSDSLYCWRIDNKSNIIDGKTTLFSYYTLKWSDDQSLIPYNYAKGEFLNGKFHNIWYYYDEKGRIIKKEKWIKGKLISTEKFNFNQCNLKEEYKLSSIPNSLEYNSIEQFKKDFFIKNGKLTCSNGTIEQMKIFFVKTDCNEFIYINQGLLTRHEFQIKNAPIPSPISYYFDKKGNLERVYVVETKQLLIEGTGHFIEYNTPVFIEKAQKYEPLILKAEGEIKNNLKIGEWKYYNNVGELEKTKTHISKDSIDVRFPHSIFNKIN